MVVWCMGGSRYIEGRWASPLLKIQVFQSFKASNFKTSQFRSGNIPEFQRFRIPQVLKMLPSFQNVWNTFLYSRCLALGSPIIIFFENRFFFDFLKYPSASKDKHSWFCESWTHPLGRKIMKMKTVGNFEKWNRKVTSPKWCFGSFKVSSLQ